MSIFGKDLIAVDIGSYSAKVVGLSGSPGAFAVEGAAYIKLPAQEAGNAAISGGFLSGLVSAQRLSGKGVSALMTGRSLIFRHLYLPPMPESDLKEAVRWELKKEGAIAGDYVSDYCLAGKSARPGENMLSIIAFAADRSESEAAISLYKNAGLKIRVLDTVPTALLFAFDSHEEWQDKVNYAALDIGRLKSTLVILRDKMLVFVREIAFGGEDITKAVADGMKMETEEAEGLKFTEAVHVRQTDVDGATHFMKLALERLCSEVHRSLDYYQAQFRGGATSKLFLCGGTAQIPGIDGFVTETLGIPSFVNDPFRGFKMRGTTEAQRIKPVQASFTVATGMAVRLRWKE
ncbi:MAG: type IV pilus assembly protein PilM [Deltaproteobacteria bacterium]|nr:type IV pilus assembly protein PilM [Deltaproteobacteria bacterium]